MSSIKSTREAERKKKRKYWRRHLQAWRDSNLSQTEYCRNKKLNIKTFGYWKRKLEKTNPPAKLVPLPIEQIFKASAKPQLQQSSGLTLIHNKSLSVEIAENFSPKALGKLIHVLAEL